MIGRKKKKKGAWKFVGIWRLEGTWKLGFGKKFGICKLWFGFGFWEFENCEFWIFRYLDFEGSWNFINNWEMNLN